MKSKKLLLMFLSVSITLLACRFSSLTASDFPSDETAVFEESAHQNDLESDDAADPSEQVAPTAFDDGDKNLFIGHSFFVPVAKAFDKIASQSGFSSHQAEFVFSSGVRGTPGMLWDNESQRQKIDTILSNGDIDLLGMTVAASDTENSYSIYSQWFDLAITYNPDTAFFIAQPWLPGGPEMESEQYATLNETGTQRTIEIIEQLRVAYPNNNIYFINYGKVVSQMKTEFDAGNIPDIEELVGRGPTSLFSDGVMGHGGPLVHELSALIWINILYAAEIDEVAHSDFSDEAMKILLEVIEYNLAFN